MQTRNQLAPRYRGGRTSLGFALICAGFFTVLTWAVATWFIDAPVLAPDRPGFWYEWQLMEPDFWSRTTAWGGYLLHQLTIWTLIWTAQRRRPGYTEGLHDFNRWAIGATVFFISLHLLQTWVFYDGLAQDVPEWTSQWSVIVLLAAVLLMENQRRGLTFGQPLGFVTQAARGVRKYHGYYFAWATIYTFWYHPMLATPGHLFGFAYMFLLLLQGSLFFTRAHTNRYWTTFLEVLVLAHGVMVAVVNGDGWPMFLTGFAGIFVLSQMHGLGLSRAQRWLIGGAYLGGVALVYAPRDWQGLWQVPLIPATELLTVLALSIVVLGLSRLLGRRRLRLSASPASIL